MLRRFDADVLEGGEFRVGAQDVLLGEIAGCEFYIGAAQFNTGSIPSSLLTSCPDAAAVSHLKPQRAFVF